MEYLGGKVFVYKNKQYRFFSETKIKINGVWVDGVIYTPIYNCPDGWIFTRTKEEFFNLFKPVDEK